MSVVHCRRDEYDVYVGRGRCPRSGEAGCWGNPFRIGCDGTRGEVIEKYRHWLRDEVDFGRIKCEDLAALHGKTLGCWCAPSPCHGDVLVGAAEWAYHLVYIYQPAKRACYVGGVRLDCVEPPEEWCADIGGI